MNFDRREFLKCAAIGIAGGTLPAIASVGDRCERCAPEGGILYQRRLPVKVRCDVFVAGGGPSGVAAAVAAARQGADVFLAESHTCLGGMSTAGKVMVFMKWGDGVRPLAAGFGTRVRERLEKERKIKGAAHDIEALKRVYESEMLDAKAKFSFYTRLIDVVKEGNRIKYAICAAPSGIWAVEAKVYIDASGNADMAACAGARCEKGDENGRMMPGTLISYWDRIDWERWDRERPKGEHSGGMPFGEYLADAIRDGVLTTPDLHFSGIFRQEGGLGLANMGHCFGVDGTDEDSMTAALVSARKSMVEYERYLHEYLKCGMENARLLATAELLGIRESRRVIGDYVLSYDDYMKRASFNDEIGRYAYPIDIHPSTADKEALDAHVRHFTGKRRYEKGESYGIPYRILTPKKLENLLVAGRCVSADCIVQASIRVIPACFITGQAAGIAAAMASGNGMSVHSLDVAELRKRLKEFGACLG